MGNYGRELKEDAMKEMIKLVREADGAGVARQTLADAVGISPSCVSNWMSEAMHRHPEIVKPYGSKVGYRWVDGNVRKPESPEQKVLKEQIIDFLKKHSPEGTTATDIAKAVGVSKWTVLRRLHEIAEDHIELNLAQRGSTRGYIWTEVVEKPSDEIDHNDVEAIQAAFGQKKERVNKLPEFTWKDEVKEQTEEKADVEETVSSKNHEGYNDPTAAAAIRSADNEKTPDTSMAGEIWAIDRQFGGEDYFAILTSSDNHVCGVILRYENGNYPYPQNKYIYVDGGAEWVGDTRRVCTKPKKALCRKVGDISDEALYALRFSVSSALELLGDVSESKVREMESCIEMQEAKIKELESIKEQNESLVATVDRLMAELETERQRSAHYYSEAKASDGKNDELVANNTDLLAEIKRLKSQLADAQSGDRVDEITLRNMRMEQAVDKATIKAYEFALQCLGGNEAK